MTGAADWQVELLENAEAAFQEGRAAEAEASYRQLLQFHPAHFNLLLRLAQTIEAQGRADEAIAAYDRAISANPGHAVPFTCRALLAFRRAFGNPPAPAAPSPDAPRITMSTLGMNGRFGNQLLQYGFLRMYGVEHGIEVEAPDWIGRDLFDLDDPLPRGPLPLVNENEFDLPASLNREVPQVYRNADLWGYCCYPTARLRRYRNLFRELFRPGVRIARLVEQAATRLRESGETVVAVHLRRGDFGYGRFWISPSAWYSAWLEPLWQTLRRPVLYVASDDPAVVAELARFRPIAAADLGISIPGAEFYPDFHLLANADVLAISNSSFSFVAAMLNTRASTFVRPDRDRGQLVPFDPWDAPVLL